MSTSNHVAGLPPRPFSLRPMPKSKSCDDAHRQWSTLVDTVHPPDLEQIIYNMQINQERDPLRHLLDFPPDDIDVQMNRRTVRTLAPVLPEHGACIDPLIRDCIKIYTSDYKVIHRRYEHFVEKHRDLLCYKNTDAIVHEYEADLNGAESIQSWSGGDLRTLQPDPVLPNLLDAINPEEADAQNRHARLKSRPHTLFSLSPPISANESIEMRPHVSAPQENFGHRILLKCLQLKLELDIEPIFASIALYDAREKKKISENFYFDMMSDQIKQMLSTHISYQDVSTLSRSCILSLSSISADVFLVVKLEKVLQQGDISEAAEPYMRDDKNREKVRLLAAQNCEKLGEYRMPFAWTAVHLLNVINGASSLDGNCSSASSVAGGSDIGDGKDTIERRSSLVGQYESLRRRYQQSRQDSSRTSSLDRSQDKRISWSFEDQISFQTFRPVTLTVSSFFKQEGDKLSDDDLYRFLLDLKKPTSILKRLKCIPGMLKLDICPCPQDPKYTLTTELYRVDPYPDEKNRPTKEILEFPSIDPLESNTVFRNLLFVYPKYLNFTNRQGSARNIAVKVSLMGTEDNETNLFGKSSSPEFQSYAYSSVTYHTKNPSFYDEVKIKLPALLSNSHYLLFSFYHISCQRKMESTPIETAIGFTWLPLLREGSLTVGDFCLPVALDRPPQTYTMLHPEVQLPGMKWVDNHKGLFSVSINAVSSIHTLDSKLDAFLMLCHDADEKRIPGKANDLNFESQLRKSIEDLTGAAIGPLVRFLTLILDRLFLLIVRPPYIGGRLSNISQTCFEVIGQLVGIVQTIEEKHLECGLSSLLCLYIEYSCTLPHSEDADMSMESPGYSTLGRSSSSKRSRVRTNSDPDIALPMSPDSELASLMSMQQERTQSQYEAKHSSRKQIHQELLVIWVVSTGQAKEFALKNSWFFFKIIIKSMAEHLARSNQLSSSRHCRFPVQFYDDVKALLGFLIRDILDRYPHEAAMVKSLNHSVAFFIRDLFSLINRSFVMSLVHLYWKSTSGKMQSLSDARSLHLLRIDFLRVLCGHEHFITLNLPLASASTLSCSPCPSTGSSASSSTAPSLHERGLSSELTIEFRSQHYLIGLALSTLSVSLQTSNSDVHYSAVRMIRNLLTCHDLDPRFQDTEIRMRISSLYLPLLGIVLDALPQLHNPCDSDQLLNPSSPPASPDHKLRKTSLSVGLTQDLLLCVMWVLKTAEARVLWSWCAEIGSSRLFTLLRLLHLTLSNFEYKPKVDKPDDESASIPQDLPPISYKHGKNNSLNSFRKSIDMKTRLEEAILGTGSARVDLIMRRKQSSTSLDRASGASGDSGKSLRWRKDQTQWYRQSADVADGSWLSAEDEGRLCTEVNTIVLDLLELVLQLVQGSENLQCHLSSILQLLLHALGLNQSSHMICHLLASQRILVYKFPELLFEEETEQCADLCLRLLRHCSSPLSTPRSQAAASLYLLMRQNFEIGNNFARVKMQVTMSLSILVGQMQQFKEEHLRKSLKTILTYAQNDAELANTGFPEQVRDTLFNLHTILSDTVKMKEYQQDPEMLLDLMYRIAKGYQSSPDLRLTWLQNMAAKHSERGNYAEASQCLIHAAGLVAEYLNMLEDQPHLPIGCVALSHVSSNVLEESAVSDDVVSPDEEGICTGKYFSETGLVGLLEQAASLFNLAGIYELVGQVYKVLMPIHEANRDYKKLADLHGKLQEAYSAVSREEGKRVFGTYFRVGFYGKRFEDLDGKEFIYKEPAITKLPEISHRLESFFLEKFGEKNVELIKDSNKVDRESLKSNVAFIQITYVEPYFELFELEDRITYCDRNYNLRRFMYATPFTEDGKAHGELGKQCKRKNILTTSHAFPYVKTRLEVNTREQIVLSPIEVAIEDVQKKTRELTMALEQDPLDPKMLQMVLQGIIGTTVNQGPHEIACVFLSNLQEPGTEATYLQNRLRITFKELLRKSNDALLVNKNIILPEQKEYQLELERNHRLLRDKTLALIYPNSSQPKSKSKQKRDHARRPKATLHNV